MFCLKLLQLENTGRKKKRKLISISTISSSLEGNRLLTSPESGRWQSATSSPSPGSALVLVVFILVLLFLFFFLVTMQIRASFLLVKAEFLLFTYYYYYYFLLQIVQKSCILLSDQEGAPTGCRTTKECLSVNVVLGVFFDVVMAS